MCSIIAARVRMPLHISETVHNSCTTRYILIILHTYSCQHCLTTGMHNILFLVDVALLSISPVGCGYIVYFEQMYLFKYCPATGMQNGDKFLLLSRSFNIV